MSATNRSRVEALIRPDVFEFEEYIAVEPLEKLSERIGIPAAQIIKLDANENPYGAAPAALEAIRNEKFYHHYPDPTSLFLREELERYTGFDKARILVGSGSDELLELIIKLFITPGDQIINLVPTFGMYAFLGQLYGAEVKSVERRPDDYSIDPKTVLAAIEERTKLIFVCSPNNPTANPCPVETLRLLLETGRMIVVDEAYYDFAGENFANLTNEYENLIVLRTFSKLSGLAGLRVGYGIFPLAVIKHLWKIKQPYNVTVAAQAAALASLKEKEWLEEHVAKIVTERERLFGLLKELDGLEPLPSVSNFIFCRVHTGDAYAIKLELEQRGIFIRYFNKPLLKNAFRISVGTPEQTTILMQQLRAILYN
ncbi:MAG: histidinol-phosphate transaminase [Chloroflexota bacterium]